MMKVGLLGFGTVGRGFWELAQGQPQIEITALLSRRPRHEFSGLVTADIDELLKSGVEIVVEAIGGSEPAATYIRQALLAGKHVVTANKQVMCEHYDEFVSLARGSGTALLCTAAAGGGIPWLRNLAAVARTDRVYRVEGILNGTTNFILDAMTRGGEAYASALKKAQELGYAEADPTADVEGYDARRKIVLSANVAFGCSLKESDVPCEGITKITAEDIACWRQQGLVCKLIASAERAEDGAVAACVAPRLFPADSLEAGVFENNNLVSLYAERVGKQSFYGQGAGAYPTGANVLADCLAIAGGHRGFYL